MTVMSEGLQKVAGKKLRSAIHAMTTNRIAGVLTGLGITAIIQSSSATTVMLVSFVNAELMTLTQSIGVIMGANIGTTATGWLVALVGFKMNISLLALVAVGIGFFMRITGRKSIPYIGEVLIGFGLIFIGLEFMKEAMGGMSESPAVADWMSRYSADTLTGILMAVSVGAILTMVIQSSSAAMALTMTLAFQGLVDFPTAAALLLGQNVGTTITANLAAIGASRNAKRCALAHMFFNVLGTVLALLIFKQLIGLVDFIVPGDPNSIAAIPNRMATFHTVFNVANTLIFLPFVAVLARTVQRIIPKQSKPEDHSLRYIDSGLLATTPMALESARMELYAMAGDVSQMSKNLVEILDAPGTDMPNLHEEIERLEDEVDRRKAVITSFLRKVVQLTSTKSDGIEVSNILGNINDLERIGDHCRNLMKLARRIDGEEIPFNFEAYEEIRAIAAKGDAFIDLITEGVKHPGVNIMEQAREFEAEIDRMRTEGRDAHTHRIIDQVCNVEAGLMFMDMLVAFEKIGDHSFNISERLSGVR
jgi:phosphate:Na+ symporter